MQSVNAAQQAYNQTGVPQLVVVNGQVYCVGCPAGVDPYKLAKEMGLLPGDDPKNIDQGDELLVPEPKEYYHELRVKKKGWGMI